MSDNTSSATHKECLKRAEDACQKAHPVRYMLEHLSKLGCEISLKNKKLLCEPCGPGFLGGFDPDAKEVVLCEDNLNSSKQLNRILTHELIHAYDVCRAKYDTENLRHLACSEVRAANLSGDCSFWRENVESLNFGWNGHQKKCVKRKAMASMLAVKKISREECGKVIDEIFDECYRDTLPFKNIPPLE